ncbi:fatty acid desaturase [Acaryochloris marina NIES-2412]|uniref:fatty acid desaturase n=1 Tax=Acaryochloris marina TaxID=155978 RepID=UPI0040590CE1
MTVSLNTPDPQLRVLTNPDITLSDIIKSLPKSCFRQNLFKAWSGVIINVLMVALGYMAIVNSPWFLLPVAWIFTGTALTGFFVIGHDAGHRSFAKHRWVNDLVGHVLMVPLIYPFHSWRISHNFHHAHTNKLGVDNAWRPFDVEEYVNLTPINRFVYKQIRGYFWWVGSIIHWANLHLNWNSFDEKDRGDVKCSITVVVVFAAISFPTLILTTGIWGFAKFWLVPWMVYHFWMSTFTIVHHTAVDIPFKPTKEWNAAEAQLVGSVHCDYPRWVEFLCHDINVHIPHHVSTAIPSYNLRIAHKSLKENWGEYVYERQFNWVLMKEIVEQCHLYDPERAYLSFEDHSSH